MSGRGRGPGGSGRGRYRGGDEVDGLERPLLRAEGDDSDDDDRAVREKFHTRSVVRIVQTVKRESAIS